MPFLLLTLLIIYLAAGTTAIAQTTAQRTGDFLNMLSVQGDISAQGALGLKSSGAAELTDLRYLGVTHYRDAVNYAPTAAAQSGFSNGFSPGFGPPPISSAQGAALSTLLNGGITVISQVPYGTISPATQISQMQAWQAVNANSIYAIEGINEPELATITYNGNVGGGAGSWLPVAQYMADYYTAVQGVTALKSLPFLGVTRPGAEINNVGLQYLTVPTPLPSGVLMPAGTILSQYATQHIYPMDDQFFQAGVSSACQTLDPAAGSAFTIENHWNRVRTFAGGFTGYASDAAVAAFPKAITEFGYKGPQSATPGVGTIYDTSTATQGFLGNTYTVTAGGLPQENGVTMDGGSAVVLMILANSAIWVENGSAAWFSWNGTAFTSGSNPFVGGDSVTADRAGRCLMTGLLNAWQAGAFVDSIYDLYDYLSTGFSLMATSGVPSVQGTYLHNMTTVLADAGATSRTFAVGSLGYNLGGMPATASSLLLQNSNGHFVLALWDNGTNWNQTTGAATAVGPTNVSINMTSPAVANVFSPVTGTAPILTTTAASVTVAVSDAPIFVDLVPQVVVGGVPPPGCTTTTCTGTALPRGSMTVAGSQLQVGAGNNVRPACATYSGSGAQADFTAIATAGFNCVELGWRDAYVASGATTYDDEFTSAQPWLTHQTWQSGDPWAYGATFATGGLAEGPTWWTNPITTPSTAAVYSNTGGTLNLGLIQNPPGSGIGATACNNNASATQPAPIACATVGTIINAQQLPGGSNQLFGYYEFKVAVPATPGFMFHWDVEDYPLISSFTMEIDVEIWTTADNVQHLMFRDPVNQVVIYSTTSPPNITQPHVYGVNWQTDFLTLYEDGVQIAQEANPGGDFKVQKGFPYFLTTDSTYESGVPGQTFSPFVAASAAANLSYLRVYQTKPTTPATGCNSLAQIQACVANATTSGLAVVFNHLGNEIPTAGCVARQLNGLWFDQGTDSGGDDGCGDGGNWSAAAFQQNTVNLLGAFNNNPTVVGYEFHNEPLVSGAFTGSGGGGTGSFSINSSGQIIDPNGVPWVARGFSVQAGDAFAGNVSPAIIQSFFPRTNYIRVWAQASEYTPSSLSSWVTSMTNLGIVVSLSDYEGNSNGVPCNTNATSWYQTGAAFYANNPYVWWEGQNECFASPPDPAFSAMTNAYYNAVRTNAPNAIYTIGTAGGNSSATSGAAYEYTGINFAPLTNVIWDIHPYAGQYVSEGTAANQAAYDAHLAGWVSGWHSNYRTNTEPVIPVLAGEFGNATDGSNVDATGSLAVRAGADETFLNGSGVIGTGWWVWGCGLCNGNVNADTLVNAGSLAPMGVQVAPLLAAMPGSGPTPAGGGGGGNPPVNWAGGGPTDIQLACSTVGAAVYAVNPGPVEFCPGPINNTGTTLLNGTSKTFGGVASTNIMDLSLAQAHPVTGFPASKIAYSVHLLPINVWGSAPDQPLATAVAVWNAYFGYLERNGIAPVLNLSVGCDCDNSQGQNADDQAFMANYVAYANGVAPGGPTFTGTQQPMGNAWNFWGASTGNPNGTLNPDATLKGTETGQVNGQAFWWSQLLQGAAIGPPPPPQATMWNPADLVGMALTGNNLIATSSASGSGAVRSTTSKSSGRFCWAITANTITGNWDAGIANSSYSLTAPAGLGGDSNGLGFDPNSSGAKQASFFNNVTLSSGSPTSASGEVVQMCADFAADLYWELDSAQVASTGAGNYNNTVGCNPTVAACGLSFSGMSGPFFIAFNELDAGGVATIGTTAASLPYALPAGFSTWDATVVSGKPLILIFGDNDNQPRAANDNRLALAERIRR